MNLPPPVPPSAPPSATVPPPRKGLSGCAIAAIIGVALAVVGGALALTGWLVATLVRALPGRSGSGTGRSKAGKPDQE